MIYVLTSFKTNDSYSKREHKSYKIYSYTNQKTHYVTTKGCYNNFLNGASYILARGAPTICLERSRWFEYAHKQIYPGFLEGLKFATADRWRPKKKKFVDNDFAALLQTDDGFFWFSKCENLYKINSAKQGQGNWNLTLQGRREKTNFRMLMC